MPHLVYLSYPSEVPSVSIPQWASSLISSPKSSNLRIYVPGQSITPELREELSARKNGSEIVHSFCTRLARGYSTRLIDGLVKGDPELIIKAVSASPLSVELRLLQDLWILSRADVLLMDCDYLGRGRSGTEALLAHGLIPSIGITDSVLIDPWLYYLLDSTVKSHLCLDSLLSLLSGIGKNQD